MTTQAEIEAAYKELMDADVIDRETVEFALIAAERARWQPIETAPKDGTWFLAASPDGDWRRISWGRNRHNVLCWNSVNYWWIEDDKKFTVWQPLPSPPESK